MAQEPKDLLKKLETETLQDLFLKDNQDKRGHKLNKTTMVNEMAASVEHLGVKSLLSNMRREELVRLLEKADVKLKEGESKNSKTVVQRRLAAAIAQTNLHDFLTEHADEELLKALSEHLDLEPESEKKEALVTEVSAAVRQLGLEGYFSHFEVDQLHDVAEDLKLDTSKSSNKRKLVEAIILNQDVEKAAPKAKKPKGDGGKKKKPIEKGITFEEVFQHYYATEVRNWCKEHGLKTSGKKPELIKRILAFLEGDETTTKPKGTGPGRKGKKGKKGKTAKGAEAKTESESKGDAQKKDEKHDEGDSNDKKEDTEKKGSSKKAAPKGK